MKLSLRNHLQIAPVALIVAALGAGDAWLTQGREPAGLIGIVAMAVVWLIVTLIGRLNPGQTDSERRYLVFCVVCAGLMLAASLAVKLAAAAGLQGDPIWSRAPGVLAGLLLAAIGDALPKVLAPLAARRCAPAQLLSFRRFSGWAFLTGGLAFAAVWIFAPVAQAGYVSILVCATAVTLVAARLTLAVLSADGTSSQP